MIPTVRSLLDRRELALGLLAAGADGALGASVRWVHSSDLPDPTPFLDRDCVLLTTGTQFGDDADPAFAAAYVARLRATGVVALGFGTEVIREGTPESLVAACAAQGLPIFEVPYRIPFIAVARAVADAVTADAYARQEWALDATRAITRAALRPDGLTATIAELSRRLGAWVGLVDATGAVDREFPDGGLDDESLAVVLAEARAMLRRGRRASRTIEVGANGGAAGGAGDATGGGAPGGAAADGGRPESATLQTLGSGGALRGVLVIGDSAELDQAGREVVTIVIALAGLALEQNRSLDRARGHVRSALVRSILAGDTALAAQVAAEMWGPLPGAPLRVLVADGPAEHADRLSEVLELRADERGGRLFFGLREETVVLVVEDADVASIAEELADEFDVPVGVSDPATLETAAVAHDQALRALERAREGGRVIRFEEVSRQGVLAFLARTDARAVAAATLAPLTEHDAVHGSELVPTVRAWLEHGGGFDRAAQHLGVHRHTVRARIATAERLLGRDLSEFHAKADLWAALLAVD
ncbi:PucR family transcriptional regulator ligand-binding domain-containing protein [Agromyces sp. MMS24-JH15]|uniref:helix-turn-helix domain-containing protein n=1 Tax=Agromyces sp. MMS24-JH15 TaxID=3243765 RepID=UPI003748526E